MPYSRATMELWLSGPPTSVTTADAMANSEVHAGVVIRATSTSPGRIWPKSSGPPRTRAGAVTSPQLAPTPVMVSPVWDWSPAGIARASTRFSQPSSGSICGGLALR